MANELIVQPKNEIDVYQFDAMTETCAKFARVQKGVGGL